MAVIVLRLEAPLMSFGGVAVDEQRPTLQFPTQSMLTGLLANALGWLHRDAESLGRLQQRLVYAVRQDRAGELLDDYQTVDLGQPFLLSGWTTRGEAEGRGGANATGTHIRRKHFLADAAYTVAFALEPADESPTLDDIHRALVHPARPLFLGRKTCLPSRPLVGHHQQRDRVDAASVLEALCDTPRWTQARSASHSAEAFGQDLDTMRVWWPGAIDGSAPPLGDIDGVRFDRSLPLVDQREWRHQFHAGHRFINEGALDFRSDEPPEESAERRIEQVTDKTFHGADDQGAAHG